jgi:hypothetical protein
MPVDYSKGKIYTINCNTTGLVYIGSTSEPTLARRLTGHVRNYKCWLNGKSNYVSSFKVLENANYEIVLLESYPCSSKDELHARERYWANQIDCVNKLKNQGIYAEIGEKEYKKQYREDNKEYFKQYRQNNKEYFKQYRQNNKEGIKQYSAQYHKDNKESIKKRQKQYHKDNRERIMNKKNQKNICDCGKCYTFANKAIHMKSTHHQHYEQNRIYYLIRKGLDLIKDIEAKIL